jgi:hypothetical protein
VALGILDSQGNILVDEPDQIPRRGQATFLDLDATAFEGRMQIRALVVKSVIDPRQRNTCPNVRSTFEVFDNDTGKTAVFVDDPDD